MTSPTNPNKERVWDSVWKKSVEPETPINDWSIFGNKNIIFDLDATNHKDPSNTQTKFTIMKIYLKNLIKYVMSLILNQSKKINRTIKIFRMTKCQ